MWNYFIRQNEKLSKSDPSTWQNEFPKGLHYEKGHVKINKISHAKFLWEIRAEPKIIESFSQLWETNQLLTSFDVCNVMLPPKYGGKNREDNHKDWQHVDQSFNKKGLHCVQGFLNLEDTTSDDGCLVLYPKSHLLQESADLKFKFSQKNKTNKCEDF